MLELIACLHTSNKELESVILKRYIINNNIQNYLGTHYMKCRQDRKL